MILSMFVCYIRLMEGFKPSTPVIPTVREKAAAVFKTIALSTALISFSPDVIAQNAESTTSITKESLTPDQKVFKIIKEYRDTTHTNVDRPCILYKNGRFTGCGDILNIDGKHIILTARHILDEKTSYTAYDITNDSSYEIADVSQSDNQADWVTLNIDGTVEELPQLWNESHTTEKKSVLVKFNNTDSLDFYARSTISRNELKIIGKVGTESQYIAICDDVDEFWKGRSGTVYTVDNHPNDRLVLGKVFRLRNLRQEDKVRYNIDENTIFIQLTGVTLK